MAYGFTNAGGGGGSTGPLKKGTIVVSYPSGATCTVSNGSKTYTALDTSGAAAFSVDAGTWTVRAYGTDGDTSESVSVVAGGWVEVVLLFELVLFQNGVWETGITGGWESSTVRYMKVSGQNTGIAPTISYSGGTASINISQGNGHSGSYNTKNEIDLSNYSQLIMSGNITSGTTAKQCGICFASSKTEFLLNYSVANKTFSASGETFNNTAILNISNVNSSAYLCIGMYALATLNISLLKLVP